jgi:hypothetical protein
VIRRELITLLGGIGYNPGPALMNQLIVKDNPLRW